MTRTLPDEAGGARPRAFKLSAAGNDFIVVDARLEPSWEWTAEDVRRACRRRHSVGADGVVILLPSDRAAARFVLRNADGSDAAFSGNGARCAALALHELEPCGGDVLLESEAGVARATVRAREDGRPPLVGIAMGAPSDVRLQLELPAGSPAATGDFAVVGVPYLAVPVPDVDALHLPLVAPPLRRWSVFATGANVAFYEAPHRPGEAVRLRTWERGVEGETLSSGTGCAIVAVSLALRDDATPRTGERTTTLAPRSGMPMRVTVQFERDAIASLLLEGEVRLVAEIVLGPDALAEGP